MKLFRVKKGVNNGPSCGGCYLYLKKGSPQSYHLPLSGEIRLNLFSPPRHIPCAFGNAKCEFDKDQLEILNLSEDDFKLLKLKLLLQGRKMLPKEDEDDMG